MHPSNKNSHIRQYTQSVWNLGVVTSGFILCVPLVATAEPIALSDVDTFQNLQPNVLLMVDDSGSMDWEVMTSGQWNTGSYVNGIARYKISGDGVYYAHLDTGKCGNYLPVFYLWPNNDNLDNTNCYYSSLYNTPEAITADWRIVSSDFNKVYYNPKVTYLPWPGFPQANFNNVRSHPDSSQRGYNMRRNLGATGFKFAVWHDTAGYSGQSPTPFNANQTANAEVDLWDDYDIYTVNNSSILVQHYQFKPTSSSSCSISQGLNPQSYTNCFKGHTQVGTWSNPFGRSLAEEQQNIANWYQYHRRRSFALRNIVAILIEQFPEFKYGLDFTTNYNDKFIPIPATSNTTTSQNASILKTIFEYAQLSAGTPLATALDRAGQYYQGKRRGAASPIQDSCQANYTVMLTDGFWNDHAYYNGQVKQDVDGDGNTGPYGSTDLADIARYYFQQDLAPTLKNNFSLERSRCLGVPIPSHQHMSTIGVTFGPFGNLKADAEGCWPDPALDVNGNWGNPLISNTPENLLARIDDLWHAAYNSNGFFTSNSDPEALLDELTSIFATISQLNISGARGTLSASRLDKSNGIILSSYDIAHNTGRLQRYLTDVETGIIASSPSWSTDTMTGSNRFDGGQLNLFSYNPISQKGINLTGSDKASQLSAAQRSALFPTDTAQGQLDQINDWLNALSQAKLGATVHSNPTYVGPPSRNKNFQADEVKAGYSDFQAEASANPKDEMIYIGDNRGFLNGYRLLTGKHVFSYLPDAMFNSTLAQTNTAYTSRVDGQITAEDVYLESKGSWASVIVGGFRKGATGYFALNVTNPDDFKTAHGTQQVLWEYSNQSTSGKVNPNLGYSYAKAAIGRMANGKWAAVFGNGYNSETGHATLIILDIETGELLADLDTGIGPEQDPLNANRDNGMAEPALIDIDQDGIVDRIYAGDLFGNLFAFDVTSSKASQWKTMYGSSTNAQAFFATGGAPITARPAVMTNPDGTGLIVIIGTGQDMTTDSNAAPANTIYGLYDRDARIQSTSDLRELKLESSSAGWSIVANEDSTDDDLGWQIPLTSVAKDYKVITQPLIELGELTVLASKVEAQDCGRGLYSSSIIKMHPVTGMSLQRQVFLDENLNPVDQDDTITDALVLESTQVVDITLGGTLNHNVVIGNTTDGKIVQINTSQSPDNQGRKRFQRIYD